MAGIIIFGWIGFKRMGVSQLPDVDFPMVTIEVTWEGAAPEVMETEVVDPVEEALMTVGGIKEVSSTSRRGQATVTAEFELSKDIDVAVQEIQSRIAQAQRILPKDMDPVIITKMNPEDQPIMWLALSGDRPLKEMMEYVHSHLKERFQTVPGVGGVFLGGFVEPSLRVWLKPREMQRLELTADDVISAITNQHAELPAGQIQKPKEELNVRVMGEASSVEEFSRITIPQRLGAGALWRTFRLSDIATIEDGLSDVRRISRVMGQPAIGLGIRKQRGQNAVEVADRVKSRLEEIRKELPSGLELNVNFDSTKFIRDSIGDLMRTMVLAVLLTALVCWLFLGSWSATLNVVLSIPVSLCGAFMVMHFLGFTLNTFTMLGLSLVIGIVVDDAIMVLENIARHRQEGQSRVQAALVGAREITFAAIAASVAIIAIFMPVIFMKGIIGKFFFQFGVTISVAVAFSLLEAITIAPMRCSQFLEVGHASVVGRFMDHAMRGLSDLYGKILAKALNRRWAVLGASLLFFGVSIVVMKGLRKEMVPAQDTSSFLVRLQTPPGSSLALTDSVFKNAEDFFLHQGIVKRYFAAIGGFGGGEVNTGILFVTLKDPKDRPIDARAGHRLGQAEFMDVARGGLRGIAGVSRVTIQDFSLSSFSGSRGFPVEFSVRGRDWDKLGEYSQQIMKRLEATGLVTDLDSDYQLSIPEVRVIPDRDQAMARGVSVASIARMINITVGGIRVGKFTKGGRRYDIRLSLRDKDRSEPADIDKIWVRNNRGEIIRLSEVTRVLEKPALLTINRKNRERSVSVFANIAAGKSQTRALGQVQEIAKAVLPEGYRIVMSGSAQTFKESFQQLIFVLVLGILVAYMILGAQFNSFIHPFTVLLALPFSVSGAFLALFIFGHSINIMSMIGILLLMGIVKKNSILLVDFTNARRLAGLNTREALLEACPVRLRPILMTSISTIAGAVPAALVLGAGSESRAPMAVAVIGGVLVSTLFTLFVVPCAYSLLARLESHRHDEALKEALQELSKV